MDQRTEIINVFLLGHHIGTDWYHFMIVRPHEFRWHLGISTADTRLGVHGFFTEWNALSVAQRVVTTFDILIRRSDCHHGT